VVGVDLSAVMLGRARDAERAEPLGIDYRELDVSAPGALAGERFDGVVCSFGLTDIDDLDGALRTVAAVLAPGGWFCFSLLHPCFPGWTAERPSSWSAEGYYREGWWLADNPGLRSRVGSTHRMLSTYVNALRRHGFVVDAMREPWAGDAWNARQPGRPPVPVYLVARCSMAG
jgi:SAM-dependent methyltransferase